MKRKRRIKLNLIRRALIVQYHTIGEVLTEDTVTDDKGRIINRPDSEIDAAFREVDEAINCINRELGIPENS